MSDLRDIPYQYSRHWRTPSEINLMQAADCKGKAVALYAQMRRNGARNLRIVIGRHHVHDSATHAWLEWETTDGSYVLDPTFNEMPEKKAELNPMTYLPLYAFDGEHKYRAVPTSFVEPPTRMTADYGSHLYVSANAGSMFAHPERISVGPQQLLPSRPRYVGPRMQHRQSNLQHPRSNIGRSSLNIARLRQHPASTSSRHVRGVDRYRSLEPYKPVIRMQPPSISAASQL